MYILNHTNTTLSVGQFADIAPGKYIKADKHILESQETAYAVRAKWATLHETPPKEIVFEGESISFETPAIEGSTEFPTREVPQAKLEEPEAETVVEEPAKAEEAVAEEPAVEAPVVKKGSRKSADADAK